MTSYFKKSKTQKMSDKTLHSFRGAINCGRGVGGGYLKNGNVQGKNRGNVDNLLKNCLIFTKSFRFKTPPPLPSLKNPLSMH